MKEKMFWDWFLANKSNVEKVLSASSPDHSIMTEMLKQAHLFHPNIWPEVASGDKQNFILILSCDGIKEGIPYVQALAAAAPEIEGWVIKTFRQPSDVVKLEYQGLTGDLSGIKVKYSQHGQKFNVEIFMKGYSEKDQRYIGLGFLCLDHSLGEYSVMTRIGEIKFKPLSLLSSMGSLKTLEDLRKKIEQTIS